MGRRSYGGMTLPQSGSATRMAEQLLSKLDKPQEAHTEMSNWQLFPKIAIPYLALCRSWPKSSSR
jgi:hypothetical protein